MKRSVTFALSSGLWLGLLGFLVLLTWTGADAQVWKLYKSASDHFQVEFSGDVKVEKKPDPGGKYASTVYSQDGGSYAYQVWTILYQVDWNFDNGVKGALDVAKCKNKTNDKRLPFSPGHARDVSATNCFEDKYRFEGRFFQAGKWFYQVLALVPNNGGDLGAARRFVESFKIVSP